MCSLHEAMPEKLSAARNRTPSARVRSAPSAKSGRIAGGSVSATIARSPAVRTEAVTAPSAYAPPTQASEPLRVRTASWARSCSGRGHAAAERDLHGAEKGRRGVEETVGGREHDDARIRLRGLSESGTDEDRLVNRPFGNADLRLASDAQDRSPVGPQRHGRGVGLGAELPGASADGEFQRRDIAAVVLGLDADAAHLPFRRAYQPAFRHRRVETVGAPSSWARRIASLRELICIG